MRCPPIEQGNEELLLGGSADAFFDTSSLHVIRCGITLTNIANVPTEELPTTLEVLKHRNQIGSLEKILMQQQRFCYKLK